VGSLAVGGGPRARASLCTPATGTKILHEKPHILQDGGTMSNSNTITSRTERSTTTPQGLGRSLRALRKERGLSLQDVANETNVSASFLSLVENERSDITIGRLVRLCDFYGVTLAELVPVPAKVEETEVVHVGERRFLRSPAEGIDIYMLAPDTGREMMPMLLEFEPAAELAEYGRHHEGEEWVYVLEGRLCLSLDGSPPHYLEAGDSAYYSAERPHRFSNADRRRRLRVVCVNTPPVF
jgi:transcriptional regulator with XRE-family HTH domain